MDKLNELFKKGVSRRSFLAGVGTSVGAAAAVTFAAGCSSSSSNNGPSPNPTPTPTAFTDADYLNFALNLEYLEAEFYLRAATGSGLSATDAGTNAGAVTGGAQVNFQTPAIQQYAMEIANDELGAMCRCPSEGEKARQL